MTRFFYPVSAYVNWAELTHTTDYSFRGSASRLASLRGQASLPCCIRHKAFSEDTKTVTRPGVLAHFAWREWMRVTV